MHLLDLLCFSIGLTEGVSMFAPPHSRNSLLLAAEFEVLRSVHSKEALRAENGLLIDHVMKFERATSLVSLARTVQDDSCSGV